MTDENDHWKYGLTLIEDLKSPDNKRLIQDCIDMYGYAPEQNYLYLCGHDCRETKPFFVSFGENKGIMCMQWDNNEWQVISQVISPKEEQAGFFLKFIKFIYEVKDCKKLLVEFSPETRKELLNLMKDFRITRHGSEERIIVGNIVNRFTTPILSLKDWNPELTGSNFSNLRKCKNRYNRTFKIEMLCGEQVKQIPYKSYESLVHAWRKNRKSKDRAQYDEYLKFFKEEFRGSDMHIALKIDGELCGAAAAWVVPGTSGKTVYYGINLHNYSRSELGDFLTLVFLDELKKAGYEHLDFGTSDERLLAYKKKFGMESQYETLIFYIRPETRGLKKTSLATSEPSKDLDGEHNG